MKFAFVFPGQGSQSLGMMAAYGDSPVIRATFDEASTVLGRDLWQLVTAGPADALNQTVNTQPLMLTAGIAVWRLWLESGGVSPAVVAGHSLGEYAALVAAEALEFREAVALVEFRARVMQDAVKPGEGAMAAVLSLDAHLVEAACAASAAGQVVEAVNYNDPHQTVIAGHATAVDRAIEACKQMGAKRAVRLAVSAPFHCSLMQPAADRLAEKLSAIHVSEPRIPVINNVDVATPTVPSAIVDALIRQAAAPVRWVETMQRMQSEGVLHVFECGPGKILSKLVKRSAHDLTGHAIADTASLQSSLVLAAGQGEPS
ncbi:MAG: ACP S-malonyltransferase [Rhodocyclales bacterium]|nr:ACP S-malonyltransferase [Rhodocyclales bacterium]